MHLKKNRKIYLVMGFTDMRKQINGLAQIAEAKKSKELLSGNYFVFLGKTLRVIKMLYWNKTGFCQGRFLIFPIQTNLGKLSPTVASIARHKKLCVFFFDLVPRDEISLHNPSILLIKFTSEDHIEFLKFRYFFW